MMDFCPLISYYDYNPIPIVGLERLFFIFHTLYCQPTTINTIGFLQHFGNCLGTFSG